MNQSKKTNSARVNLVISLVFHSLALGAIFFFAGREGMLGKRLKEITVSLAPKEKKPEVAKPKPAEPKPEPPKLADTPKPALAPAPLPSAPAPASDAPPAVAPPSVALPAFVFNDGAKEVQTSSDVNELYKAAIERALRSHWNRAEDIRDENYTADIELSLDKSGAITRWQWLKGSGDKRWDDSIKAALAQTKALSRPPPPSFPAKFVVRFDVEAAATEPVTQLSQR